MDKSNIYNIRGLLTQVAAGDQVAFRSLYEQYKDDVYAFVLGVTRAVPVAEEIVQESFTKVWLNRNDLPQIEKFEGWLFTITRNLCYTALRRTALEMKARTVYGSLSTDESATGEDLIITKENQELIHQAIQQLPAQQRRVYLLSRQEGMTYDEIAHQLNISRNTVKEHLRRATDSIRTYLESRLSVVVTALIMIDLTCPR